MKKKSVILLFLLSQLCQSLSAYTGSFSLSAWVKIGKTVPDIIVDNTDSGFSTSGTWGTSATFSGFLGDNFRWATTGVGNVAVWRPEIIKTGNYKIYMRWTDGGIRPGAAPIEIVHSNGMGQYRISVVTVDQGNNGGKWNLLGVYPLDKDLDHFVKIVAWDTGTTVADAVMFVYYGEDVPCWYDGEGIINGKTGDNQNDFGLTMIDGKPMFGVGEYTLKAGDPLSDGRWHSITAIRQDTGGIIILFINGTPAAWATGIMDGVRLDAPQRLAIGGRLYSNEHFFKGALDEIRIYNKALPLSDIQKLYSFPLKLKACYSFNDAADSTALDSSGNGYNGTVNGAMSTMDKKGYADRAYRFSGNEYITTEVDVNPCPGAPDNKCMTNVTFSAWIYPTANSGTCYIFGNKEYEESNNENGRGVFYENGYFNVLYDNRFERVNDDDFRVDINSWQHIAVVYDKGAIRFYKNGQGVALTGVETMPSSYISKEKFSIGARSGLTGRTAYFAGKIDDVRIYHRAFSDPAVKDIAWDLYRY